MAYIGTHRHSTVGDHAYEFTYMFKFAINIPIGATEVVLPDNKNIVIFAATLAKEPYAPVKSVSTLFRTANKENNVYRKLQKLRLICCGRNILLHVRAMSMIRRNRFLSLMEMRVLNGAIFLCFLIMLTLISGQKGKLMAGE